MIESRGLSVGSVQLRRFDVVPLTPIRDPLRLSGANVVAESESDAWQYLYEYGGWRESTTLAILRTQYRMVPRDRPLEQFGGSKTDWIQAVHLGYCPPPVRLTEDTQTQWKMDRRRAIKMAVDNQRIRKLTEPNPWERFSYWLEQQQYHPVRWRLVGFVILGIVVVVFWQLVLTVLLCIVGLFVLIGAVGG
jgi:hypothetical protein